MDLSRLAPGPMAAMILGDLGADVIKIEEPGGGRRARDERTLRGTSSDRPSEEERRARACSPLDRNKRSIVIDLRHEAGREVALRIASTCDVLVEGFRPGVVGRLGVDYQRVKAVNPGIVYCSITGYGQSGARAHVVGHDLNYLAYAGALSLIGTVEGRPVVPINVVADYAAGSLHAAVAILAALLARRASGQGQFLDVSIADGVLGLLGVEVARLLATGRVPRSGTTHLTGGVAYYNIYETSDGRALTIACVEPHFFARLCELLDLPELAERQFADAEGQRLNYESLRRTFAQHSLDHWVGVLKGGEIPFEPVRALDDVLQDDGLWSRGAFVRLPAGEMGTVTQVASPIHMSETPTGVRWVAPEPGANAGEILRGVGYTEEEIAELRSMRAVAS